MTKNILRLERVKIFVLWNPLLNCKRIAGGIVSCQILVQGNIRMNMLKVRPQPCCGSALGPQHSEKVVFSLIIIGDIGNVTTAMRTCIQIHSTSFVHTSVLASHCLVNICKEITFLIRCGLPCEGLATPSIAFANL